MSAAWTMPSPLGPCEWAAASVDYARSPAYEVELKGPYDPDYMPYWREPMACVLDRSVREVWVLKCARSGGSENLLLTVMRWAVATRPQPMLYVSGQQQSVERFLEKRIKPGMALSRETARKMRAARVREHEVFFEDCDLIATWPKNTMAFKQAGYSLIFGDEVSTWPEYSADMLRKRTDNWSFSHILCVSSPDPQQTRGSDEDPIFVEYRDTDRRVWVCDDPATGHPFTFRLGAQDTVDGLKWDREARGEDGAWDLDRVRATAHYVTPDGTRIDSADRMRVVRGGRWVATNDKPPACKRGYHVTGFMVPFACGDFGPLAAQFLAAKHKGVGPAHTNREALKTFFYETLAEPFYETRETAPDSVVAERAGGYGRGVRHTTIDPYKTIHAAAQSAVVMTCDVQKDHLYWLAREFVHPGHSALIAWGRVSAWEDMLAECERYKAAMLGIDYGFALRETEVFRVAHETRTDRQWVVPLKGLDKTQLEIDVQHRDPFLGERGGGVDRVQVARFRVDTFRLWLLSLMRGENRRKWFVYDGIELTYAQQVTAMERTDGAWKLRRGHNQEHLFDCEVMALVVAKLLGLWDDAAMIRGEVK